MIGKIWIVAAKDLRQLAKDRGALIMLFAVPLLLIALLGSALSNAFDSTSKITVTLPVVDHDGGPAAQSLIQTLRHVPSLRVRIRTDQSAAEKAVRDGDRDGLLIIPSGFSTAMQHHTRGTHVTYYSVPDNSSASAQIARGTVSAVVQQYAFTAETAQVITNLQRKSGGTVDAVAANRIAARASKRLAQSPPVAVNAVNATGRKINASDNTVPGYALMFALFGVMGGARSVLEEKESGTFRRLLVAPMPRYALLGGKLLAQFIQSAVQLSVLFTVGALLFHINLGSSIPALALLVVATSFAACGLGLILISFIKSERQVRPITMMIVLSFSALGGSWWPVSIEPSWMQSLSKLTINGWAMQGFNGLMIFDRGFAQVLPDIGALLIYGLVCMAIARRTFRFSET